MAASALLTYATLIASQLPYAPTELIFQSESAIQDAGSEFLATADHDLKCFVELSRQGIYSEAYSIWSGLLFRYFSFKLELGKTEQLSLHDKVKTRSIEEKEFIAKEFQKKLISCPDLLPTLLNNTEHNQKLSPQERLFTEQILKEYQKTSVHEDPHVVKALEKLSGQVVNSYASAPGKMKPIDGNTLRDLKVLSANVCCFPGTLCYTYGGVRPWRERIDHLVEKICSSGAEIVCLQEVWDPEAMHAFIEKLADDYACFVYNAGDPAGTLDVTQMGYSSGLFVASKLSLDSVSFNRFPLSLPIGSNRGEILATCRVAKERIAFINTHLNHAGGPENEILRQVRHGQLIHCYGSLQALFSKAMSGCSWGFVAGDFNIDAFSEEFNECGLPRLFSIPYAKDLLAEEPTWTDYFNDLVVTSPDRRQEVNPVNELVDYCIQPAVSSVTPPSTRTLINLYSLQKPIEALSDHQGLLTTWQLQPQD